MRVILTAMGMDWGYLVVSHDVFQPASICVSISFLIFLDTYKNGLYLWLISHLFLQCFSFNYYIHSTKIWCFNWFPWKQGLSLTSIFQYQWAQFHRQVPLKMHFHLSFKDSNEQISRMKFSLYFYLFMHWSWEFQNFQIQPDSQFCCAYWRYWNNLSLWLKYEINFSSLLPFVNVI